MPGVNLIPREILRTRLRQQRVRFWLIVAGMAWLIASGPVARETAARHQLRSQQAAVDAISAELQDAQTRCSRNSQRLEHLKQQIARAARLRYKRPWTAMFSAVAGCLPVRVWLTSLGTDPPRPATTPDGTVLTSPAVGAGLRVESSADVMGYDQLAGKVGPKRLVLEGHALGLEDIYAFVDALQDLNVFAQVGIRTVGGDTMGDVKVTRFALECNW